MKKRCLAIVGSVALGLMMLAGCGSKSSSSVQNEYANAKSSAAYDSAAPAQGTGEAAEMPAAGQEEGQAQEVSESAAESRKLIKTVYLDMETRNFDEMITNISKKVEELGGYLEPVSYTHLDVYKRQEVIGSSMEHTLYDGDNIIVDKISYRFHEPERFDVIVFPYQHEEDTHYIKRVIGLPGESVRIDEEGTIFINGEELQESYGSEVIKSPGLAAEEILLGTDEYFVLGDNRNASADSRDPQVGNVKRDTIVGKAWLRIWPLNKIEFIRHQ